MATRALGTLTVDLLLRMGGFKQGMDQAARESDAAVRRIRSSFNQLRNVVGTVLAGFSFAAVVRATAEAEKAFGQLKNAVETNGGAAGKTADELANIAGQLQSVTTYSDDAIQGMQALLLRFKGIGETRFDQATEATLDLATALGQDLNSAARLVGLALDNPVEGLSRLSRLGVAFTKEQKELIKSLVDTGKAAEAQGFILSELERRFGGAAQAARGTFAGALEGLKNAFGDLLEVKTGIPGATDALNEFTAILEDPNTKRAADTFFSGIIIAAAKATKFITETAGAVRFLAESMAAVRFGPAAGDAVRIEDEIAKVKSAIRNPTERLRFFGRDGIVTWWSEEELQAELKRLEGLLEEYGQNASPTITPRVGAAGVGADDIDLEDVGVKGAAAAQKQVDELAAVRQAYADVLAAGLAAIEGLETPLETQIRQYEETRYALEQLAKTFPNLADEAEKALQRLEIEGLEEIKITAEKIFPEQEREQLSVFWDEAARNFQNLLADFLFDPFEDGIKGMLKSFGDMLLRMAAEAAAAQIGAKIFGAAGSTSGGWLGAAMQLGSAYFGGGSAMSGLSEVVITAKPMASGGLVTGPGTGTSDSIPALLSNREYVVPARAVSRPGVLPLLESIRAGLPRFADGGLVSLRPGMRLPAMAGAGQAMGMSITQQFSINAPAGTISRATEQQIAAAASRGLAHASRRNN